MSTLAVYILFDIVILITNGQPMSNMANNMGLIKYKVYHF